LSRLSYVKHVLPTTIPTYLVAGRDILNEPPAVVRGLARRSPGSNGGRGLLPRTTVAFSSGEGSVWRGGSSATKWCRIRAMTMEARLYPQWRHLFCDGQSPGLARGPHGPGRASGSRSNGCRQTRWHLMVSASGHCGIADGREVAEG
jgi:hypothetical protein